MIWWHIESSPRCSLLQQCSLYWMAVYIRCAALSLKTSRYWQCCRAALSICVRFLPCHNNTEQITQPSSPFLSGLLFLKSHTFLDWMVFQSSGEKKRKMREAVHWITPRTVQPSTSLCSLQYLFWFYWLVFYTYFSHFLFDLFAGHFRPFALCTIHLEHTHTHTATEMAYITRLSWAWPKTRIDWLTKAGKRK